MNRTKDAVADSKSLFLATFSEELGIGKAAANCGISRRQVVNWQHVDADCK